MKLNMNLWIDEETKAMIQNWVDKGYFKSPSEFARDAFVNHLYFLHVSEAEISKYMEKKNALRN